jgi:hypothetical protein
VLSNVGLKKIFKITLSGNSNGNLFKRISKLARHFSVTPSPLLKSLISVGPSKDNCK